MAEINITSVYGDTNGLADTIIALNTISNGLFVDFLLVAIFITFLFLMRNYEFRNSFISSSTIVMFVAVLLWAGGITEFNRVAACFSIFVIALFYSWTND